MMFPLHRAFAACAFEDIDKHDSGKKRTDVYAYAAGQGVEAYGGLVYSNSVLT